MCNSRSETPRRLTVRGFALCLFVLHFAFSTGCDSTQPGEAYEVSYRYPVRDEAIVVRNPPSMPADRHEPGTVREFLRDLPKLGGEIVDPLQLSADQRTRIGRELDEQFGSPAEPRIAGLEADFSREFKLDADSLKRSVRRYKISCAACHGLTGNGLGPTGLWSNPHPRDFRSGKFKSATGLGQASGRPRLADLQRVLKYGLPGVPGMGPTNLTDDDNAQLIGYVLFLSIRGEAERELIIATLDAEGSGVDDERAFVQRALSRIVAAWKQANESNPWQVLIEPAPERITSEYQASLQRGRDLFFSEKTGCGKCHVDGGESPSYQFDAWGVPNRVRNLKEPQRLWAREPLDQARQLKFGIAAANMPAQALLGEQDIIDLVNFTREWPYPARLPAGISK